MPGDANDPRLAGRSDRRTTHLPLSDAGDQTMP